MQQPEGLNLVVERVVPAANHPVTYIVPYRPYLYSISLCYADLLLYTNVYRACLLRANERG